MFFIFVVVYNSSGTLDGSGGSWLCSSFSISPKIEDCICDCFVNSSVYKKKKKKSNYIRFTPFKCFFKHSYEIL